MNPNAQHPEIALNYLKDCLPLPNQPATSKASCTLQWLPLAADVMIATGVVCCVPYTLH